MKHKLAARANRRMTRGESLLKVASMNVEANQPKVSEKSMKRLEVIAIPHKSASFANWFGQTSRITVFAKKLSLAYPDSRHPAWTLSHPTEPLQGSSAQTFPTSTCSTRSGWDYRSPPARRTTASRTRSPKDDSLVRLQRRCLQLLLPTIHTGSFRKAARRNCSQPAMPGG